MEFKIVSYELASYDPVIHCHINDENVRWLAVPELWNKHYTAWR